MARPSTSIVTDFGADARGDILQEHVAATKSCAVHTRGHGAGTSSGDMEKHENQVFTAKECSSDN